MSLKLRQEIEVWYVIPAIRKEIAKGLVKKGLKQRAVARKLEITDAAVSQYFNSKRGGEFHPRQICGLDAAHSRRIRRYLQRAIPLRE